MDTFALRQGLPGSADRFRCMPHSDCVTFDVDTAAASAARQLGVLPCGHVGVS